MPTDKLIPCPLCGGNAELRVYPEGERLILRGMCRYCGAESEKIVCNIAVSDDRWQKSVSMAVRNWNSGDVNAGPLAAKTNLFRGLKIRYLNDSIKPLEYIEGKSDWVDLRAAEDVEMKQGEFRLIHLGIAVELPRGYEAHIVPRSSTFKNFGILQTNSMGIIDETYRGDNDWWFFPALAMRDTAIHAGDRICQFRIMPHQPTLKFLPVEHLNNEDRGGHGSTGVK